MAKLIFFIIFILGVMFYPVVVGSEKIKNVSQKHTKILPKVQFLSGDFLVYDKKLIKKGNFKELDMYNKVYVAKNLVLDDLVKQETYNAKKTVFRNDIITAYDVKYKNKDINLITTKAVYDKKKKVLSGNKFKIFSKDFRGYGAHFEIDDKKDIYAKNIIYYIKVEK